MISYYNPVKITLRYHSVNGITPHSLRHLYASNVLMNFKKQDNKFQYLLDYADFYNSEEEYLRAIKECEEHLMDEGLNEEEKLELNLAIIWIKLHKGDLYGPNAEKAIEELEIQVRGKGILEKVFEIVQVKMNIINGAYMEAETILNKFVKKLKYSEHYILFALAAKSLVVVNMVLGNLGKAEEYSHDCISIFRKFNNQISLAFCLINYGVIKKKLCLYTEAERLYKKSLGIFMANKSMEGEGICYGNLGILYTKMGDWKSAEYYLYKSNTLLEGICRNHPKHLLSLTRLANFYLLRRHFDKSKDTFFELKDKLQRAGLVRELAISYENIGALMYEMGDFKSAHEYFNEAEKIICDCAPLGDVRTTIKRRRARLLLKQGDYKEAMHEIGSCIQMCKNINDKYELGAVLNILGEYHLKFNDNRKAVSAFEASINILKSIQESYELMNTCISYAECLVQMKDEMAEIYLLEAKQLCKKMQIDYYMCCICVLLGRCAIIRKDFVLAQQQIKEAESFSKYLSEVDKKRVMPKIKELYSVYEASILKNCMNSAQELQVVAKLYEEARFPLDEIRPESAMKVANHVGASRLFMARKKNNGYRVDLVYNSTIREAKKTLKIIDRKSKGRIFKRNTDPKIYDLGEDISVVTVPGKSDCGYVLCATIDDKDGFSARHFEYLFACVGALERLAGERSENIKFKRENTNNSSKNWTHPGGAFKKIITINDQMIEIIRMAERASQVNVPILLEGETGVGKELFARAIHIRSPRAKRSFVAINAGGVNVNLLESQLFGHTKGAFTDACNDRVGLIEESEGGSIFFDEIGEMSEELQVKLLRLLENKEFRRLGDNKLRRADVRIISATNRNLSDQVDKGLFRKDLFYRLSTVRFSIPPLRHRIHDIELLVRHLLKRALRQIARQESHIVIDMKALEAFELYNWPGNVRELQNEILRLVSLMGNDEVIRFNLLSDNIRNYFSSNKPESFLERNVERFERRLILKALEQNDWNRIRTAEQIGIPRTTLIGKMKRLKIVK